MSRLMLLLLMFLELLKKELELLEKLVSLIVCIINATIRQMHKFKLKMWSMLHSI